jgi:hypothetical protein
MVIKWIDTRSVPDFIKGHEYLWSTRSENYGSKELVKMHRRKLLGAEFSGTRRRERTMENQNNS